MQINIKRAYVPAEKGDGFRVLVDRLWPRGLSREKIQLDSWNKEVAPSTELRKWFGHDPEKWEEFQKKYWEELKQNKSALDEFLKSIEGHKQITLLYGAKDEEHNQAVALLTYLKKHKLV